MTAFVERGVYIAPWLSNAGGMILISITREHKLASRHDCQPDENPYDNLEMMWAELNMLDPLPALPPAPRAAANDF
jgi:hypothetical protein